MKKIHAGDSYFPFLWSKDDGVGNAKVTDPSIIYVARERDDGFDTWEKSKVIKIDLKETVDDFVELVVMRNGKISNDQTDNAKKLIDLLRNLATYVEEQLGE